MSTWAGTYCTPCSITVLLAARAGGGGTKTTAAMRRLTTQAPRCVFMRAELSPTPDSEGRQSARERQRAGLTAGVAGDPADRHVDPVAGHGPVFLRLAAPEAVLPVVAGPAAARPHGGAGGADGAGLGLPTVPGLG